MQANDELLIVENEECGRDLRPGVAAFALGYPNYLERTDLTPLDTPMSIALA